MRTTAIAAACALFVCALAFAHSVSLWAEVDADGSVAVEAFAADGGKVKNARILVVDTDGNKLLEGKTDSEGKFVFAPEKAQDMNIILLIDDAHSTNFLLGEKDFKDAAKGNEPDAAPKGE